MAQRDINLGTPPAGTDGDTVRQAFEKIQANTTELYQTKQDGIEGLTPAGISFLQAGDSAGQRTAIGLGNVNNTSDANKPVSTAQQTALAGKVDKVEGKGLSTHDFTSDEKNKLGTIGNSATTGAAADAYLRARANHTGTQLASTISDFAAGVRSTLLTGLGAGANVAIAATDSLLSALAKLQAQLSALGTASARNAVGLGDVYARGGILGAVSVDGAGVPTGAIIERGSNSNGEFLKFADGTMICTVALAQVAVNPVVAPGNMFNAGNLSFPANFVGTPVCLSGGSSGANADNTVAAIIVPTEYNGLTGWNTGFYVTGSTSLGRIRRVHVAIGKWR